MPNDSTQAPDVNTIDGLIQELEDQAALLISVATGGPRIDSVQSDYVQGRQRLVLPRLQNAQTIGAHPPVEMLLFFQTSTGE